MYLSWDELPDDERPPERIWGDPEKLSAHFKWVKRKRRAEMDGKDAIKDKPIEDAVENDAASMLING